MTEKWTPIEHGKHYCSPACGCKCLKADFERATKEANSLCKHLSDGWEPRVWENGGWNYMAVRDGDQMHVWKDRHMGGGWTVRAYTAETRFDGEQFWPDTKGFPTPEEAIEYLRSKVSERVKATVAAGERWGVGK